MKIEATVRKYEGEGGMKGFADIVIEDMIVVTGLTIRESQKGDLYCSMPSKKCKPYTDKKTGELKEYSDVVFPITKDARQAIIDAVLSEYNKDEANSGIEDSSSDFPF